MNWKFLGSAAAALVLVAISASFAPAGARGGHGGHGGHHGAHSGGPHLSIAGPRHHFHRHSFVRGYPYYAYYGDGCDWLRRRALYTGSPYWWQRYEACRYGNGYGY
jgi:hypothetical protein